jgi:hypothetical protein
LPHSDASNPKCVINLIAARLFDQAPDRTSLAIHNSKLLEIKSNRWDRAPRRFDARCSDGTHRNSKSVASERGAALKRRHEFCSAVIRASYGICDISIRGLGPTVRKEGGMSLVRLLGFTTLACGCVIGRYREVATSREVSYVEEKGKSCGSHGHRRNHTVAGERVATAPIPLATKAS